MISSLVRSRRQNADPSPSVVAQLLCCVVSSADGRTRLLVVTCEPPSLESWSPAPFAGNNSVLLPAMMPIPLSLVVAAAAAAATATMHCWLLLRSGEVMMMVISRTGP